MSVVLTVGKPTSGFALAHEVLTVAGLAPALPSRREGVTPENLQQKLLKAIPAEILVTPHPATPSIPARKTARLSSAATNTSARRGKAITKPAQPNARPTVGRLWTELALDIFMANIDQDPWGWAHSSTLELADFWAEFDPRVHFVLVYTPPELALARSLLASQTATDATAQLDDTAADRPSSAQEILENWTAFNTQLLSIHHRHPHRSILINLQDALREPGEFVRHVAATLRLKGLNPEAAAGYTAAPLPGVTPLALSLAQNLLRHHHASAADLYHSLEEASHGVQPATFAHKRSLAADPEQGWQEYTALHARLAQTEAALQTAETEATKARDAAHDEAAKLLQQISENIKTLDNTKKDANATKQKLAELIQRYDTTTKQLAEVEKARSTTQAESAKLLQQVAEISKIRDAAKKEAANAQQKNVELIQQSAILESQLAEAIKARDTIHQEATKLRQQLALAQKEAKESAEYQQRSNETLKENELLLLQLHQLQEELEKHLNLHKQGTVQTEKQIEELTQARDVAKKEAADIRKKAAEAVQRTDSIAKQLADAIKVKDDTIADSAKLRQQISELTKARDTAKQEAADFSQQASNSAKKLADAVKARDTADTNSIKLQQQIAELTKARDVAKKETAEFSQQVSNSTKKLADAVKAKDTVEANSIKLQQQIVELTKACDAARKEAAAATDAAAELSKQTGSSAKELEKENELLLLQLHQVQEELEHHYLKHKEIASSAQNPSFTEAFWQRHPPELLYVDLRHHDLVGNNWYEEESDGRWAGPANQSSLQFPGLPAGDYGLDLTIVDAIAEDILQGIKAEVAGKSIFLHHEFSSAPSSFPIISRGQLYLSDEQAGQPWTLNLSFPRVISPSALGQSDIRELTVRIQSVRITRL